LVFADGLSSHCAHVHPSAPQINELLSRSSNAPLGVVMRERRNSKGALMMAPSALDPALCGEAQSEAILIEQHGDAVNTAAHTKGIENPQTSKLFDPSNVSTKLTGAAARGARAAAFKRVKEAATEVGGMFLTNEEWSAMRAEMTRLKIENKRLATNLAEAREQAVALTLTQDGNKENIVYASPVNQIGRAIGRAFGMTSPVKRPTYQTHAPSPPVRTCLAHSCTLLPGCSTCLQHSFTLGLHAYNSLLLPLCCCSVA
jgi:hypothetical protein